MKVAFVTTYGQHCGIARYSETVVAALRAAGVDVRVYGEADAVERDDAPKPDVRSWRRGDTTFGLDAPCDILHVQHETGFWRYGRTLAAAAYEAAGKRPTNPARVLIVTVHTPAPLGIGPDVLDAIVGRADHVVTLADRGATAMRSWNYPHVDVIPHPITPRTRMEPTAARAMLVQHYPGLANFVADYARPFFLCLGFLSSAKQLFDLVAASGMCNKASIILAGPEASNEFGAAAYVRALQRAVFSTPDNVYLLVGTIPDTVVTALYSLAAGAIVPTVGWSGSGALATAAAFGVPIIASGDSKDHDRIAVCYSTTEQLARCMEDVVGRRPGEVAVWADMTRGYTAIRTPDVVAAQHIALYESHLA